MNGESALGVWARASGVMLFADHGALAGLVVAVERGRN
jgi:hypothetical protein